MEWKNAKEHKPKYSKSVLVYCVPKYRNDDECYGFEINVGYLEVDDTWYLNSKNLDEILYISHWIELPNPPNNIIL